MSLNDRMNKRCGRRNLLMRQKDTKFNFGLVETSKQRDPACQLRWWFENMTTNSLTLFHDLENPAVEKRLANLW